MTFAARLLGGPRRMVDYGLLLIVQAIPVYLLIDFLRLDVIAEAEHTIDDGPLLLGALRIAATVLDTVALVACLLVLAVTIAFARRPTSDGAPHRVAALGLPASALVMGLICLALTGGMSLLQPAHPGSWVAGCAAVACSVPVFTGHRTRFEEDAAWPSFALMGLCLAAFASGAGTLAADAGSMIAVAVFVTVGINGLLLCALASPWTRRRTGQQARTPAP